jgi:hypothetical protein
MYHLVIVIIWLRHPKLPQYDRGSFDRNSVDRNCVLSVDPNFHNQLTKIFETFHLIE